MSLIQQAEYELHHSDHDAESQEALLAILDIFFETFDSGGAVHAMIPVLQRLLCGQPLSPLTGKESEWFDPLGTPEEPGDFLQNRRCSSVFKTRIDIPHRGLAAGDAYDIAVPMIDGKFQKIVFPYSPETLSNIPSPVLGDR